MMLTALSVSASLVATMFPPQQHPFRERTDLQIGSYAGYSVVQIDQRLIVRGLPFEIQIEFHNVGEGNEFYNPFFDRTVAAPAQLAIYDSEKKYLGDLLYKEPSSNRNLDSRDWTFVPKGGFIGIKLNLMGANLRSEKL